MVSYRTSIIYPCMSRPCTFLPAKYIPVCFFPVRYTAVRYFLILYIAIYCSPERAGVSVTSLPWSLFPSTFHLQMRRMVFKLQFSDCCSTETIGNTFGNQRNLLDVVIIPHRNPVTHGWVVRLSWPNLILDIISHSQHKSTNPWMSWAFAPT